MARSREWICRGTSGARSRFTYIYGIGRVVGAAQILTDAGVDPNQAGARPGPTTRPRASARSSSASYKVEGDLRREVSMNIKRLMDIGSYRGHPPPQGPARARPAHPHQRAHPQGPAARASWSRRRPRPASGASRAKKHRSRRMAEAQAKPGKPAQERAARSASAARSARASPTCRPPSTTRS